MIKSRYNCKHFYVCQHYAELNRLLGDFFNKKVFHWAAGRPRDEFLELMGNLCNNYEPRR